MLLPVGLSVVTVNPSETFPIEYVPVCRRVGSRDSGPTSKMTYPESSRRTSRKLKEPSNQAHARTWFLSRNDPTVEPHPESHHIFCSSTIMIVASHRRLGDESRDPLDYVEFIVTIVGLVLLLAVRIRHCRQNSSRPTPEEDREREHRQRILMRQARLRSLGINPYYGTGDYSIDNRSDDTRRLSAEEAEEKRKEWKDFLEEKSLSTVRSKEAHMELFACETKLRSN